LPLLVAVDDSDDALVYVSLSARCVGLLEHARRHGARLSIERRRRTRARTELVEYLAGRRTKFTLPLRPLGSPFELEVWDALTRIPYGTTCSYGDLASSTGRNGSARAVGRANGANPLPIVVPCHRVIGATGDLVGFGGGLAVKRWLLQLEHGRRPPSWRPGDTRPTQLELALA
jgi:methylated-DNA-[protein]-cysteine S-methyltransferase